MMNENKINDAFLYFSAVSFVMLLLFSTCTLWEGRPAYEDLFNYPQGLLLASKKRNQKY